jgi:hypothetical protein
VFENEELRRIFGPKKQEVVGGWGRLHNEELYQMLLEDEVKVNQVGGICSTHGRYEKCIQNFFGKPEGKRYRRRWEDNIRMNLGKVWREGADCIHLPQDRDQ